MQISSTKFQVSGPTNSNPDRPLWKGIVTVAACFVVHLTLGSIFTLGNMSPYMISYLRAKVDPKVEISQAIWINALSYAGQGSFMVLGGLMERKLGARLACFVGAVVFCGCTAVSTLTIKQGFIPLAMTYGLGTGIGLGICYISVLALGMKWFPERKGLVNGIVVSGTGLGALILNPIQTALVNPDNKRVDPEVGYFTDNGVLDSVPVLFLYLTAISGAMQLLSICVLFPVPEQRSEPQVFLVETKTKVISKEAEAIGSADSEIRPETEVAVQGGVLSEALKDINTWNMLKCKEFYFLWFAFALHVQAVQFVNTYYKSYGETFISDDHFLSTVGSVAAIFNCLGRISWGRLQDRFPYKVCMLVLSALLTVLMGTFCLVHHGGRVMFTVWVLATFFTFAGVFSLMPTATSLAFGQKHAGTNYGIMYTAPAVMTAIGALLIQFLQQTLHWTGTFLTLAGLDLAALFITLFVPRSLPSIRMKM